jgi:hypothetical protein
MVTCQVVLFNAWGVALASDSAVTSGNRVLHGSEKVFALDLPHKVAILTSSNARIMNYPWESVLSAWSDTLTRPLPSVADYWHSLEKWLSNSISSPSEVTDAEFDYLESVVYWKIRDNLIDNVWKPFLANFYKELLSHEDFEIAKGRAWNPEFKERMNKLLTPEINEQVRGVFAGLQQDRVESFEMAHGLTMGQATVWIQRYFAEYNRRFEKSFTSEILEDLPDFENIEETFLNLAATYVAFPDESRTSWICMAGFGENDLLPSGLEQEVFGVIAGVFLKGRGSIGAPIDEQGHAFYGQREALDSLVFGQDSLLLDATAKNNETLSKLRAEIPEGDDALSTRMREVFDSTLGSSNLEEAVLSAGREKRLMPFQRAIQMSPVKDLADFAGTLVGVQAAQAAFTQDNPTVGGPIDVAIITRHEGFQWIRRK